MLYLWHNFLNLVFMLTIKGGYIAPDVQRCDIVVERGYSVTTVVGKWEAGDEYDGSAD